jgi:hypothetical protein
MTLKKLAFFFGLVLLGQQLCVAHDHHDEHHNEGRGKNTHVTHNKTVNYYSIHENYPWYHQDHVYYNAGWPYPAYYNGYPYYYYHPAYYYDDATTPSLNINVNLGG